MIIETSSWRLALAARFCRLFPPGLSGSIANRMYPPALAERENAGFTARCSLANLVFSYPRAEHVATTFALQGFYDWQNVLIANAVCRPGDTLIEVGANIGTETLLYAKVVGPSGRVIAFEPVPENFEILSRQVAGNHLDNVVLHRAAVSDRDGVLSFLLPKEASNFGEGTLLGEGQDGTRAIHVNSLILDQLHDAGQLPAARIMLMDVQGAELKVLRGGDGYIKEHLPYIVLEVSGNWLAKHQATPADIDEFLRTRGYRAWSITRWGLRPAVVGSERMANWFCVPDGDGLEAKRMVRRVCRRLKLACLLPLIKHVNPAVVTTS